MNPNPNKDAPRSLYVHIPFCSSICPYCDFPKVLYRKDWAASYLLALFQEAADRQVGFFSTIYVGGGTPSCLEVGQLDLLLSFLEPHLRPDGEFSIECNPDSLTEEKTALLARHGVNRVSLGAQSSTRKSLATLGRKHDFASVERAVGLLRKVGINNINVDWMYGFPNQSEEDLQADISAFLSLDVPHLSAYSLILEPGTMYAAKGIKGLDDDAQQTYFEAIRDALIQAGYERYEVSNFARPGYRCRHNLTYWRDEPYLAIGLGASGYIGETRYVNTKNLAAYLEGRYEGEVETLTKESEIEDFLLTNLRLNEGFALSRFQERFGEDFIADRKDAVEGLVNRGLLIVDKENVRTTPRGMDLLDTVLLALFPDD